MNALQRRLVPILAVWVGLFALSAVVESPVTDAAPMLFGGLVVLAVATGIVRLAGTAQPTFLLAGVCLLVGGLSFVYAGLATAGVVPAPGALGRVGDVAFVVGLVVFAYDRGLLGL